jgi:phage terminase large subunit
VKEARQKTDAQYADDLIAWLSPEGYKDSNGIVSTSRVMRRSQPRIVLDPSAASLSVELSSRGLWVVDADNDVSDGIRKVSSVMAKGLLGVNRECSELIRELPAYMWDPDALKVGKEKPIKSNDHGCDALRYGIKEVFTDYRLIAA